MSGYQSRTKSWIAGEVLYAADLNAEFDAILATLIPDPSSTAQGDVLYKGSSTWDRLAAGTKGQALTTGGTSANPSWAGMTTAGDIEYFSTNRTRLAKGTAYQLLQMNSGATAPEWTGTLGALTVGGNLTLSEDIAILIDFALSADGKYCALAGMTGTAGADLSFGETVYFASADSKWELTDADAEATTKPMIGIVVVAGDEDESITVMTYGTIREDDWSWTTPGAPLFIDEGTGGTTGGLTETAPSGSGDCIRIAGYVIDSNSIFFCPENAWDEHA